MNNNRLIFILKTKKKVSFKGRKTIAYQTGSRDALPGKRSCSNSGIPGRARPQANDSLDRLGVIYPRRKAAHPEVVPPSARATALRFCRQVLRGVP